MQKNQESQEIEDLLGKISSMHIVHRSTAVFEGKEKTRQCVTQQCVTASCYTAKEFVPTGNVGLPLPCVGQNICN